MPERRYKVKVYIKAADSRDPGREDPGRAFNFSSTTFDKALRVARGRLEEQGMEVVSISHAPDFGIVATVAREPRKGAPSVLVANAPRDRKVLARKGAGR